MTETCAEGPQVAWLDAQQVLALGSHILPLFADGDKHQPPSTEQAEEVGGPFWPSDFSDDSMDIFTNTLCYGAGSKDANLLCNYCFFNTAQLKDQNMMSLESLDEILDWALSEPDHIRTASLLGGEFGLHPHAKEITRRVWAAGFNIRIVTNGSEQFRALLDDDEFVGMLQDKTRNNLIAVSLDSISEKTNDKNRGPGAARMALATIDALNRPGREIPFRINATPLLNCIGGLPALYRRAEELGSTAVIVHYPDAVGRGRSLIRGPQSRNKTPQQPNPNTWEKVRAGADVYNRSRQQGKNFVRCERGFAEVTHCPMIERSSSLHFAPQVSNDKGTFIPVVACAFSMEKASTDSAYILRGGEMRERRGSSQLITARKLLGKTACCPLYPGRACIYNTAI